MNAFMKLGQRYLLFAMFFLSVSVSDLWGYEKLDNGVLVKLSPKSATDPTMVRLDVCADGILRVTATREKQFSWRESLIVPKRHWNQTAFSVHEKDRFVWICTSKLKAKVSTATGEVIFCDTLGNDVLREQTGGGKIISATKVMGEKTWHVQQLFESPADEAFFGLGQHQN